MNNPESITVSLEMAKMLKEAGFPQYETYFAYKCQEHMEDNYILLRSELISFQEANDWVIYASPLAEEILRELPPSINVNGNAMFLDIMDDRDWIGESSWDIGYSSKETNQKPIHVRSKDNLANACAKMYIYLKENNLLES